MSGEPVEVNPKAESYAHFETLAEQNKEYRKNIQEAKDNIRYNMIEETAWFDDVSGHVGDWYEEIETVPELTVLCNFVERVRRRWFLLYSYNRDVLYDNSVSLDELQWLIMKTLDEEMLRHIEKREEEARSNA